jgi:hypothetical protein
VQRPNGKTTPSWLLEVRALNSDARPVIEALFHRAVLTLGAVEDPDLKFFRVRTAWPKFRHEYLDAYWAEEEPEDTFQPDRRDLDQYLTVLSWGRSLDHGAWQIVTSRAQGYSWTGIADRLRISPAQVEPRYHAALDMVCRAALFGGLSSAPANGARRGTRRT